MPQIEVNETKALNLIKNIACHFPVKVDDLALLEQQ